MKKQFEITVNGKTLPCGLTMGAMLRFKELTGHEVSEIQQQSVSDLVTYLYCCTTSACRRNGVEFSMSLMEFADSLSPDELNAWTQSLAEQAQAAEAADETEEKKSR